MIKFFLITSMFYMYVISCFSQTCQPNDPYDQIVSDFHSTIARRQDGSLVVWGERKANNGFDDVLSPQEINSVNYPSLTGKPIIGTLGSNGESATQAILLTSTGLFAWGNRGAVIGLSLTTSSSFQKITVDGKLDGLPVDVSPSDVNMMTATYQSLAIVTNVGEVWILGSNPNMYGDGSTGVTDTWHQVQSATAPYSTLKEIVQFRMSGSVCFAVDSNNDFYTWGNKVINQNGFGKSSRAIILAKPPSMTTELPKMIATTSNLNNIKLITYFVLTQNGELYSMGNLGGVLTRTTQPTSWVRVKANSTDNLENVMFISAQDNDAKLLSVAAITRDNNLWAWGENELSMIGGLNSSYLYPIIPRGFIIGVDKANYVEVGGHTLVVVKDGADRFCYVGHRINGSMGDGTDIDGVENAFNCVNTPVIPLCALCPATTNNIIPKNQAVCDRYPIDEFESRVATLSNNNSVYYQWQSSTIAKNTGFVDIKTATNKNYTSKPLTSTTWFRRIVKNTTPNCPLDSSNVMQVTVNPIPLKPLLLSSQELCAGDTIELKASAAAGSTYSWMGPDKFNSSAAKPLIYNATDINSGQYTLSVTNKNCSSDTVSTTVLVRTIDLHVATAPLVCEGRSILLEVNDPLPSWTYLWTGPDAFSSNKKNPLIPQADADKMGTYTVNVRDELNCTAIQTLTLALDICENVFSIPEGFSPNGDGVNDFFVIRGLTTYPTHSIVIFNRWGEKVFQASPYNNDWQGLSQYGIVVGVGEGLPEGTYFYLLDKNNGEDPIKGSLYLKK